MARSILRQRESCYGGGGSMVVVSKSESCCYLLCGRLGSDLIRVFQCFSSGGGVGDTSDSESLRRGKVPVGFLWNLKFCFLYCGQQVPLRSKVREIMDVVWK